MAWMIPAAIGGGAVLNFLGSQSAADAQAGAANNAANANLSMFNTSRSDMAPWRDAGVNALALLRYGMGLPQYSAPVASVAPTGGFDGNVDQSWLKSAGYDNWYRQMVAQPGDYSVQYSPDIVSVFLKQTGLQPPSAAAASAAGPAATPTDFSGSGIKSGSFLKPFGMEDFQTDPGYGFRLQEGMKALERSAAARGSLLSGSMLKGINRYAQDYASGEYTNAYNRYNQNQSNQFNRLAAISGVGQTTAQQTGAMGVQTGANVGNAMMAAGNARASGYIGAGNAITGAVNSGLGYYQQNKLLNKLFPSPGAPQDDYSAGYY